MKQVFNFFSLPNQESMNQYELWQNIVTLNLEILDIAETSSTILNTARKFKLQLTQIMLQQKNRRSKEVRWKLSKI